MSTNKDVTILALVLADLILMYFTFWIVQGGFSLKNRNYFVFVIFIRDMFSYTGLAEVDITKVTIIMCNSGFTNVTPATSWALYLGSILATNLKIFADF